MSEDKKANAFNWIQEGALANAQQHLDKAEQAKDRGSVENAQTHLSKALDSLSQVKTLVSDDSFEYPNLTKEENKLYRGLLRMEKFDRFTREKPSKKVLDKIAELRKKAWGEE